MVLVCQVFLQDHLTKGQSNIMGKSRFKVSHQPAKFGDHRHCDTGDMFLVCHVI